MAEAAGEKSPGRRSRGSRVFALALGSVFVLLLGCGPSIQPIHEGSVRFEHCYRLDLDPRIAPAHRHACWKQWLEVYSYGQSRDRVEHSRHRIANLEAGDPNPPKLNLELEEARAARQFYMATPAPTDVATPAPTDVYAPPPAMATPTKAEMAPAPGDTCVVNCQTARTACLTRCETSTSKPPEPEPQNAEPSKAPAKPPSKPPSELKATSKSPAPAASSATSEESAVGECECERDYKSCGVRCFE